MKVLTKGEKESVEQICEVSAKYLIAIMKAVEIPNFIETTIIEETSGDKYKLRFEKL